jgi:hypothetical protein
MQWRQFFAIHSRSGFATMIRGGDEVKIVMVIYQEFPIGLVIMVRSIKI